MVEVGIFKIVWHRAGINRQTLPASLKVGLVKASVCSNKSKALRSSIDFVQSRNAPNDSVVDGVCCVALSLGGGLSLGFGSGRIRLSIECRDGARCVDLVLVGGCRLSLDLCVGCRDGMRWTLALMNFHSLTLEACSGKTCS